MLDSQPCGPSGQVSSSVQLFRTLDKRDDTDWYEFQGYFLADAENTKTAIILVAECVHNLL